MKLYDCSLQPGTRLNLHYRYLSRNAQKGKDVLKFQKFQKTYAKLSPLLCCYRPVT